MKAKKYFENFAISSKESIVYLNNGLTRVVFLVFSLILTFSLWNAIYIDKNLTKFEFKHLIWYLFLTRALSLCLTDIDVDIVKEFRYGNISIAITKPYNFILFELSRSLGKSFLINILTLFVSSCVATVFVGCIYLNVGLKDLCFFSFVILNGILIDWEIKFLISILAFWISETKGIMLVYQRLVNFLGGVMIPCELFPEWLKKFNSFLPANFIINLPAKIITNHPTLELYDVLRYQIIYVIILFIIISIIYKGGVKTVNVKGG